MFGKHEEISNISIPFGFLYPKGPVLQGGGGLHFTVKRNQENRMLNHFNKKNT